MTDQAPATTTTTTADPGQVTTATTVKPAYKTTEAWMSFATAAFGAAVTSGLIADGSTAARIGGFVLTALSMAFHSWSRTTLKAAA